MKWTELEICLYCISIVSLLCHYCVSPAFLLCLYCVFIVSILCIYFVPTVSPLCFYCFSIVSLLSPLWDCFRGVSSHQHHDGSKVGGSQQHLQVFGHLKDETIQTETVRSPESEVSEVRQDCSVLRSEICSVCFGGFRGARGL